MKTLLFGAGQAGRIALDWLGGRIEIEAICDNDPTKWGIQIGRIPVVSPEYIKQLRDKDNYEVIISSMYYDDIAMLLHQLGITHIKCFHFKPCVSAYLPAPDKNIPLIDTGSFLERMGSYVRLPMMTFSGWGSHILDYALLAGLNQYMKPNCYLEIGSWIGESLKIADRFAKKSISVSLPDDAQPHKDFFSKRLDKHNFCGQISRQLDHTTLHYGDSQTFDFSNIAETPDLVFIDGKHTYEAILSDTRNVFSIIDPEHAIIVWHDFKRRDKQYVGFTVAAVFDTIPPQYHDRIFGASLSMCGLYIPPKHQAVFNVASQADVLYVYDCTLRVNKLKIPAHNIETR